jgi:hypothetical protein
VSAAPLKCSAKWFNSGILLLTAKSERLEAFGAERLAVRLDWPFNSGEKATPNPQVWKFMSFDKFLQDLVSLDHLQSGMEV